MIYEFSFSNFRSYKSEATIDFTAKPINEFSDSLIYGDKETMLLPVCAIYGPNGGGKSSVLIALRTLRDYVTGPLIQMTFMRRKNEKLSDTSIESLKESVRSEAKEEFYYKWDDKGKEEPSKFSILFQYNYKKYRYELEVKGDNIVEENLYMEKIKSEGLEEDIYAVFERDEDGVYMCEELEGIDIENMNESLPLLSYIALFKDIDLIDDAMSFFLNIQFVNFDKPSQDRKIWVKSIEEDKKRILNVIQRMGIDISDLRVEYDDDGKIHEIYTRHQIEEDSFQELKLREESSGTRKIFSVIPMILRGIDDGRMFVLDELDAKLHPVLLRRIIELFTNSSINKAGAQMLFTSHDLTTMCKEVFRRDEIWFSAINGYNESVLYSLVDFKKENGSKPRNDENYNKQYLEGRYGADPYMKCIQDWEVFSCH